MDHDERGVARCVELARAMPLRVPATGGRSEQQSSAQVDSLLEVLEQPPGSTEGRENSVSERKGSTARRRRMTRGLAKPVGRLAASAGEAAGVEECLLLGAGGAPEHGIAVRKAAEAADDVQMDARVFQRLAA